MFSATWARDMAERVIWTFIQSAAAVMIVQNDFTPEILKIALTAGGIAVLKAIVAMQIGNKDSAATLPAEGADPNVHPSGGESGDFNVGGSGILGLIAVILIILVCIVWLWLNIDVSDDPGAAIEAARTLAA